jgi:polysaccharide pyruvyl transferase WcaK-like protein
LIKWALSSARYRSFRDHESRQYMAQIGFDRSDPIVPDLAHSLPDGERPREREVDIHHMVVGISPIAYGAPGLWYKKRTVVYQTYLDKLADFIKWLVDNHFEIVFFPSAVPSDTYVIKDLIDMVKKKFRISLNEDPSPVMTVSDLLSRITDVDVVVASRFHGVLLPFVLHKPVIALSYHPKDISLMKDMGQADYCLDIENFEVQSIKDCFQSIQNNFDTVLAQIIKKEAEYRKLLDEQYDIVLGYLSQ